MRKPKQIIQAHGRADVEMSYRYWRVLLLFFVISFVAHRSIDRIRAEEKRDDQTLCLNNGPEPSVAIESCGRLIQSGTYRDHELAVIYVRRGLLQAGKKDFDLAKRDYEAAISLDQKYAVAYYDLANLFSELLDYKNAIINYDKAISIDIRFFDAYNNRCYINNFFGYYDRAIEDCGLAIRYSATMSSEKKGRSASEAGGVDNKVQASFYVGRGNAFVNKGNYDGAIADYEKAVRLDSGNASAILGVSKVYMNLGDYGRAISSLDDVIRLRPLDSTAWNNRCWARAIWKDDDNDLQTALMDCNKSLELVPNSPSALDSRGFVYLKTHQYEKSIADYSKSLLIDPNRASSLYGRGLAKIKNGEDSGKTDLAAAINIKSAIAEEFRKYGVGYDAPK